jgi:hypothetical protein
MEHRSKTYQLAHSYDPLTPYKVLRSVLSPLPHTIEEEAGSQRTVLTDPRPDNIFRPFLDTSSQSPDQPPPHHLVGVKEFKAYLSKV